MRNGFIQFDGHALEYQLAGPQPDVAPTLVLLHEGLGCAGLWGIFPERLAQATGMGVLVWSRAGYGASDPVTLPRPLDYMTHEALVALPAVLAALGFQRGLLVGHSDGASIAAIYAGSVQDHRIRGLCLIAPHFFVEDMAIAAIAAARQAYDTGDLRKKLARWHKNVDVAFRGWNDAWLDPRFRTFDITAALASIRVPVQIIQGEADPYGTQRQIDCALADCACPVEVALLPGIGHAPHREAADQTVARVAGFARHILCAHEGCAVT